MRSMILLAAGLLSALAFDAGAAEPAKKTAAPAAPAAAPAPAPVVQPLLIETEAIDAALRSMVDSQKVVGVSGLVFQGGREV